MFSTLSASHLLLWCEIHRRIKLPLAQKIQYLASQKRFRVLLLKNEVHNHNYGVCKALHVILLRILHRILVRRRVLSRSWGLHFIGILLHHIALKRHVLHVVWGHVRV